MRNVPIVIMIYDDVPTLEFVYVDQLPVVVLLKNQLEMLRLNPSAAVCEHHSNAVICTS